MEPLNSPHDPVCGNVGGGRRRLPEGRQYVTAQYIPKIHGRERRRGVILQHAAKLAFGIVISIALANFALRHYSAHGPMDWGMELSAVGPSVETIEKIKAFSLTSFLKAGKSDQNSGDNAGNKIDVENEIDTGGQKVEEEKKTMEKTKKIAMAASTEMQDAPGVDTPDPVIGKAEEEKSSTLDEHVKEREKKENEDEEKKRREDEEEEKWDEEKKEEEKKEEEDGNDIDGDGDPIQLKPQPKPVEHPNENDEIKRDRMRRQFAEEKARALAWPTPEDLLLTPSIDTESGVVVPFPPSKGVIRKPIVAQPPLHRPRDEVEVEKILVFLSSSDRGQRVRHLWGHGDKMETIEVTLASLASWCERGFDVTLWFLAAWKVSEEDERIKKALQCERIGTSLEVRYWDDYPLNVDGYLSSKHRLALAEAKDDFDFFISIEDDMHLRPVMLDAFLQDSGRLAKAEKPYLNRFFPGFVRIEHDPLADQQWAIWETDAADYEGIFLGGNAGWWGLVGGNR
ncbi:Hypothetical protein NocV09_03600360 [Nannochloropsis oceanica]